MWASPQNLILYEQEKQMEWVFAQVFLAFAVAVFIVWWTFPKNKKPKAPEIREQEGKEKDQP